MARPRYVIATGEIRRAFASVCEHPWYPGLFLLYHLADGCGRELFLYSDALEPWHEGSVIWAEGILLRNGGCRILEIERMSICGEPDPDREDGDG